MTSGTLVIWSLSRLDNGTRRSCPDGSTGVRDPVWTASGMGHWKRLIKIPDDTDCYYCINNMTCLIHVYDCLVVLITVPDTWFAITLLLYLVHVTLSVVAYYACSALHLFCFCIPCRHHYCRCTTKYCDYSAYTHLHVPIASAHPHVHFYHITTSRH